MKKIFILAIIIGLTAFAFVQPELSLDRTTRIMRYMMETLDKEYADEVNTEELMYTAMRAAVSSLDPYSVFYDREETIKHFKKMDGIIKVGIGVSLFYRDGYAVIYSVNPGSTADQNDLRIGDRILEIDGEQIWERYIPDVTAMLEGEAETTVKLKIQRPAKSTFNVELKRQNVLRSIVPYYGMLNDQIAYIKMNHFWGQSADSVKYALEKLQASNDLGGLVLDMRNNNGGSAFEAVELVNLFVPKDKLVYEVRSRNGEPKVYKTENEPIALDLPLTILIDQYTSSAPELVSAALQDYDRAVIIGENSFGKGLTQQTWFLGDSTSMFFTLSKYYTPLGRSIQKIDYSRQHLGEEAVDYTEDKKSDFKTVNGRTLRDLSGIVPDIEMEVDSVPSIVQKLQISYPLFDYVNLYRNTRGPIGEATDFKISDEEFALFLAFLEKENYNFGIEGQDHLTNFETSLNKSNFTNDSKMRSYLNDLKRELNDAKLESVIKEKEAVKEMLEYYIVSRYYNNSGEWAYQSRHTPEIDKAIEVLLDKKRYRDLLSN